jgi:hypothetical protein
MKSPILEKVMNLQPIGFLINQLHLIESHGYSNLIANYSRTRLYPTSSWLGRLWAWFYQIYGNSLQEKNLLATVDYIFQVYRTHLDRMEPHLQLYRTFTRNKIVDLTKLAEARRGLYAFYQATGGLTTTPYISMIKIESLTKTPFPVRLIRKMGEEFTLTPEEDHELALWFEQVIKLKIPLRWLHEAICNIVEEEAYLETKLAMKFMHYFTSEDLDHIKWRDGLKEGDRIWCNQRTLTLGKKLGRPKEERDSHVYFEIKDEADKLVYIGINRTLPGIKKVIAEKEACGIKPAKIYEVDSEGKCAIVERLPTPLTSLKWTSVNEITDRDSAQARPLINWLVWSRRQDFLPHNLQPEFYMLNEQRVLRTTKGMRGVPFSFSDAEQFVSNAINNSCITRHIMYFVKL